MTKDMINMGSNVEVITGSDNTAVMQARSASGMGTMTLNEVLPGIQIINSDFHMREIKSEFVSKAEVFCVDHCREGRIEQEIKPGVFRYAEAGDLRIDNRTRHNTDFYFPLSHYHGISVGFEPAAADASLRKLFADFPVSITRLRQKFCSVSDCFFIRGEADIEHIFSELYNVPQNVKRHYLIIKILELLLYLGGLETENGSAQRPYFYKSQTEKVKAIHVLLSEDLRLRYTLDELTQRFNMPLTRMKNCFKAVYGKSIYSHLRSLRMNRAATLLRTTTMSISKIAGEVGYDSPSKFSSAFKDEMHILPLEYRNTREDDDWESKIKG
ncbi:transcriptional regulator, AraC family [Syntrophobotulus glycolicus DSM 8271]|uniref:Transcriptional regulator, AraC family n=1 Tax=Syntrophobotulus glycolicus (strain DSM 8271 / FlGlyR) TaxID=645991 RepID=F0SVU2_SYNGF|nr:AraC family transcriptional regulator [Syntrophobotulus glycolicus]ADY55648.1 transcriptional regulator, AraC family [Syntrophobotulus glycolicus DSM 8271]